MSLYRAVSLMVTYSRSVHTNVSYKRDAYRTSYNHVRTPAARAQLLASEGGGGEGGGEGGGSGGGEGGGGEGGGEGGGGDGDGEGGGDGGGDGGGGEGGGDGGGGGDGLHW